MYDYKESKIFKVYNIDKPEKYYIGGTVSSLLVKLSAYGCEFRKYKKGLCKYKPVFDLFEEIDIDDDYSIKIAPVEKFRCCSKLELNERINYHIKNSKCYNNDYRIVIPNIYKKTIEYNKSYYKKNKNKMDIYSKEYYKDCRKRILNYHKEKIKCDCGSTVSRGYIDKHMRTDKHIRLMNTLNNIPNDK